MKTLLPIKSFEQFVIWLKTLRKVCTCDTLGLGLGLVTHLWSTLHMLPNILFLFLFQMFAAFQILETPTLFCVFVPFVFKLWLSGSILHLSSNLVPLTRLTISNHMLYKKTDLNSIRNFYNKYFGMSYSHHLICNISAEPWVSGSAGN